MTRGAEGKKFKSTSKTFHLLLSFLLTSAYKPQPMKIDIFLEDFRYDRLPPNDCFTESQSKNSYFFRVPRGLPGDPTTAEPENSGLEIGNSKCLAGMRSPSPFPLPFASLFALSPFFARPKLVRSPISFPYLGFPFPKNAVFLSLKTHRNACYAG